MNLILLRVASLIFAVGCSQLVAVELPGFTRAEVFSEPHLFKNNTIRVNVTETRDGELLVGGSEGLFAFDGHRWTALNIAGVRDVMGLGTDLDGRILVGTYEHLGYLERQENGEFAFVSIRHLLPPKFEESRLFFTPTATHDAVYFVSFNTVFRWDRGQVIQAWSTDDSFPYLLQVDAEVLISSARRGLFRVKNSEWELIPGSEPAPGDLSQVTKITGAARFRDGWLMTTERDGFRFFDGQRVTPIALPSSERIKALPGLITNLKLLKDGQFVITDLYHNLYFLNADGAMSGQWAADVYQGHLSTGSFVDREKNIWATLADGLMRVDWNTSIRVLDERAQWKETPSDIIAWGKRRLFPTQVGTYEWIQGDFPGGGTSSVFPGAYEVLGVFDNDLFHYPNPNDAVLCTYPDGKTEEIMEGRGWSLMGSLRERGLIYATTDTGLFAVLKKEGGRWRLDGAPLTVGIHFDGIKEGDSHLWLMAGEGRIARAMRKPYLKDLTVFDERQGLGRVWIHAFNFGHEVLFGTQSGICYFDETTQRFRPDPRFAALPAAISSEFRTVETDRAGNIWIGTPRGAGILRKLPAGSYSWDGGALSSLGTLQVHTIQRDVDGWMWCRTTKGVFAVQSEIGGEKRAQLQVHLGEVRDLTLDRPLWGAYRPASLKSPVLPYTENALQFEVIAPDFETPEAIEYQFLLEGNDATWSDWIKQPVRRYPALSQGQYNFRYRARNASGAVTEGASFGFSIQPPLYRTPLAYAAYVVFSFGLVWSGSALYARRLRLRNSELEKLVDERTADLTRVQRELIDASRLAGMADVARSVLHNVGNVLNSVNVSATLIAERLRSSQSDRLGKLAALFREHADDLPGFLAKDSKGTAVTNFIVAAAEQVTEEKARVLEEVMALQTNIDHIKEIVAVQQVQAASTAFVETLDAVALMEDAYRLNRASLHHNGLQITKHYQPVAAVRGQRGKVLQVLVRLVQNAERACLESGRPDRLITLSVDAPSADVVRFSVRDNGSGINTEHRTSIFAPESAQRGIGGRVGLHHAANEATEMNGQLALLSGSGEVGAWFALEIPVAL